MSKKQDKKHFISLNNSISINDNIDDISKEMLKPFRFQTSIPGKKIRQNLARSVGLWLSIPEEKLIILEEVIGLIHNLSILIDDIQDRSLLRRGIPTAYLVYGITKSIICSEWAYCHIIEKLGSGEFAATFTNELVGMFAGQGMDIYWRDNNICPTEKEYLEMVYRKTGLFFGMLARIMPSKNYKKLTGIDKFLTTVGVYFQIDDDYQNLCSKTYHNSKGFCEDISEGKYSFPVVHAVNNFPEEGKIIKAILKERTFDIEKKKYCLSILEKCGSLEYTRQKRDELKQHIEEEMIKLDPNPLFQDYIETALLHYHSSVNLKNNEQEIK